ncbi:MAG: hypothetical protein AAF432_10485 [Planctomycetota bacterium]
MKIKKKPALFTAAVVLAAGAYVVMNTRLGVHFALDVISEIGQPKDVLTSATDGPLIVTAMLSPTQTIPLPDAIEQPSGIKHRDDAIYISTDQTEIFTLDTEFRNASTPFTLLGGLLLFKQGSLEGIEVRGDTLFAIGEFGVMPTWSNNRDGSWTRADDVVLPPDIAELEFSGITDTPHGLFATMEERPVIVNLDSGSTHDLSYGEFLKDDADPSVLTFSGLAYANGSFFILSETYTSIIIADATTFELRTVFGIEPSAAADLSLFEGQIYIVIDHNYTEQRQNVRVYDIDAAMRRATESDDRSQDTVTRPAENP